MESRARASSLMPKTWWLVVDMGPFRIKQCRQKTDGHALPLILKMRRYGRWWFHVNIVIAYFWKAPLEPSNKISADLILLVTRTIFEETLQLGRQGPGGGENVWSGSSMHILSPWRFSHGNPARDLVSILPYYELRKNFSRWKWVNVLNKKSCVYDISACCMIVILNHKRSETRGSACPWMESPALRLKKYMAFIVTQLWWVDAHGFAGAGDSENSLSELERKLSLVSNPGVEPLILWENNMVEGTHRCCRSNSGRVVSSSQWKNYDCVKDYYYIGK